MNKTSDNLNRFILVVCLLIILPVCLTVFTLNHLINDLIELEVKKTAEKLSKKSKLIAGSVHSESFLKPIFTAISRNFLSYEENEVEKLQKLVKTYSDKAGVKIDAYPFDSSGNLIETNLYPPENAKFVQFLWDYGNSRETETEHSLIKPELQAYFGREFHPRMLKLNRNKIINFSGNNRNGMIYFSRKVLTNKKTRGIILITKNLPDLYEILNSTIKNFSDKDTSLAILIKDKNGKLLTQQTENKQIAKVLDTLSSRKSSFSFQEGKVWKRTDIADFAIIAGQNTGFSSLQNLKLFTLILALIILVLGIHTSYKYNFSEKKIWVSIRLKLVIVFIFAVYLPLLGLFFISFKGLQDRRAVLENEARKGMLDVLYKIDSDFSIKEEEILATFNKLYKDHSWQKKLGSNWHKNDKLIRKTTGVGLKEESFFNWLEIRGPDLDQIFCTARRNANRRVEKLNRVMAQISLEKFSPSTLTPTARRIRQTDFIIRNLIENPVLGFTHFFEVPGQLVPMEFEGAYLYWYWNYYPEPVDGVAYFASNTKVQFNAIKYLQKYLKRRFNLGNTALKLISFHPYENTWLPQGEEVHKKLINLNRLCTLNQRVTTGKLKIKDQSYLATCFPGTKLRDVYLTSLYPERQIKSKIATLRNQIYTGMVIIFAIAVLTGLLLTRAFLKPAGELRNGLMALRRRDTGFRVEIDNNDEFGDLGETFNQMMLEVKEMLLAKAVQQCLIPTDPPLIEGYELVIHNQMATDVGGDYADAFILPDNRFLVVLGDVTGHGISSSILTAMVKALIFRFSKNPTSLPEILRQLSEMVFDLLKRRKLMTFCAVIIEKDTGKFIFANAGHPYPIICRQNGQTGKIEHGSLPLGVSKKRSKYSTKEGILNEGETLFLYTDGIAEATNSAEKIFGFDRLETIISQNHNKTGELIRKSLLDTFWNHYGDKPLDDDLTFIILKRDNE
ncbi:MAG: PP2C family protein-serine/threonine phosphatase [Candidatus Rifleibacteriota bacterium]